MPGERILISGAGVAGSVLAYWLAQHNFDILVVERSRADQKVGQGIEIEEPALQVVRMMGILDKLEERKTGEMGFEVIDEQRRSRGRFGLGGFSMTGALELMRGDLVEVLYQAANASERVEYRFETSIQSLRQTDNTVIVEMTNRSTKAATTAEFDLVIGADGIKSHTRHLAMGSPEQLNCYKRLGAYVAYFSIPKESHDWPYSRLCHYPNRRALWTRPTGANATTTSAYIIHLNNDVPRLREANASGNRTKQKEAFAELLAGLGGEAPRVVQQMLAAENFYSDELMQVQLRSWSQHRVALVGDAAWAPTPFTGEGNQLAIIGAWVLAQELSRNRNPEAFDRYEQRLRTYVYNSQSIPLGGYAPAIFVPQTALGIGVFRMVATAAEWVIWLFARTGVSALVSSQAKHEVFDLESNPSVGLL